MSGLFMTSAVAWCVRLATFVGVMTNAQTVAVSGREPVQIMADDLFVPDRMVRHLDTNHGGLKRYAGACSAARLAALVAECEGTCKRKDLQTLTGEGLFAHSVFGEHTHGVTWADVLAAGAETEVEIAIAA